MSKLSIIIPIYNVENYIDDCLNSILSQNIKECEILLIDDGSTDSSKEICDNYAKKYENIKVYHVKNRGVSAARNYGIKKSNSNWIWFIDGDDIIAGDAINYIMQSISIFDMDILIFGYTRFVEKLQYKVGNNDCMTITKNQAMHTLFEDKYSDFLWNKVFRSNLFENIKFPDGRIYEDMAVIYKLYDQATNIILTDKKLYGYRIRENSYTNKFQNTRNIHDAATARYEMFTFLNKKYSINLDKLRLETMISIVSYLHRTPLNVKDNEIKNFSNFLANYPINSNLNLRYRIELFSFKYCKSLFKLISVLGKIKNG